MKTEQLTFSITPISMPGQVVLTVRGPGDPQLMPRVQVQMDKGIAEYIVAAVQAVEAARAVIAFHGQQEPGDVETPLDSAIYRLSQSLPK